MNLGQLSRKQRPLWGRQLLKSDDDSFQSRFGFFRGTSRWSTEHSNTDWVQECFQRGRSACNSHWDAKDVRQAQQILLENNVPSLCLPQNAFAKDAFHSLLAMLADHSPLKDLRLTLRKEHDLEAIVDLFVSGRLQNLELDLRFSIGKRHASLLQRLVRIPSAALTLVFFPAIQNNYSSILLSMAAGIPRNLDGQVCGPQVFFRNVILSDQSPLPPSKFSSLVCETKILTGLDILPYTTFFNIFEFLIQLIPLLAQDSPLEEVRISPCVLAHDNHAENGAEVALASALKEALIKNTRLRLFSFQHDFRLQSLLETAVFPALSFNQTLQELDFHHVYEKSIIQSFLKSLPYMKGIRSVRVHWDPDLGQQWILLMQVLETLWHVEFSYCSTWRERLTRIEQNQIRMIADLCRRNRLIGYAREMCTDMTKVSTSRRGSIVMERMEEMAADSMGLSGIFLVVKSSVDILFVHR